MWLIATKRTPRRSDVSTIGVKKPIIDLSSRADVQRISHKWHESTEMIDSFCIAVEVPANWTALQQSDRKAAFEWRINSDRIFQSLIGIEPRKLCH